MVSEVGIQRYIGHIKIRIPSELLFLCPAGQRLQGISYAEIKLCTETVSLSLEFPVCGLADIDQDKPGQADDDPDDLVPGDRLMIEQVSDKDQDHSQHS